MRSSLSFARMFFTIISVLIMTAFVLTSFEKMSTAHIFNAFAIGCAFGLVFLGADSLFRRFNLKDFNTVSLGMLFGLFMGAVLHMMVSTVIGIMEVSVTAQVLNFVRTGTYLLGVYLGVMMTVRAVDEIYISIPFVRLKPQSHKKRDILFDDSVLADPRIIDITSIGLFDKHVVVPRFIVRELCRCAEDGDETIRAKSRRSLDVLKKLEGMAALDLTFSEIDFPDVKDSFEKLVKLARLVEANILTADSNMIQTSTLEGVRVINLHVLSNALKPIMQAGEHIKIKVQRYGKEPKQGVGYLEDGTMVVINGGGDFIGETVKAQVLSVKHTSSGRMVFCNIFDAENEFSFASDAGIAMSYSHDER
jgi:uncharacterized protein YacL